MKAIRLFENSVELLAMMQTLSGRRADIAPEIMRRLESQRAAATSLGRFSQGLNLDGYGHAREMLPAVVSGFMPVERLYVLMLQLECDFRGAAARAQRATSGKRFDAFWDAFDALVRRRTCRTAEEVYEAVKASGVAGQHPKLSVAKRRYGRVAK
ncbi:hypothetical protein [Burkholderia cenocepacia]|uniref:hypothetical protein n=1 Tax=Burkholderia cenocepacia TaxID=95486 RepID=UPI00285B0D16|nr:hypothetical protein [Burkholderia cenocepacia]MDR8049757.1 hypothetical protein [Burkholderia cenocepacia]